MDTSKDTPVNYVVGFPVCDTAQVQSCVDVNKFIENYAVSLSSPSNVNNKLVVNLSDFPLNDDRKSLLSLGLSFCPTPGEPDMGEIKKDLDRLHRKMRVKSAFEKTKLSLHAARLPDSSSSQTSISTQSSTAPTRSRRCKASTSASQVTQPDIITDRVTFEKDPSLARYVNGFKHPDFKLKPKWGKDPTNPPDALIAFIMANKLDLALVKVKNLSPQNLTKNQKKALKELKQASNIIIKEADKGSVIMNRDDYIKEGETQLRDTKFYKKVDRDLTHEHNRKVTDAINEMLKRGEIHPQTAEYLINESPRTAVLYLLPKIHKNKILPPGRPIISVNECPTERISQFVDFFLQTHLHKLRSYVRDTSDLILKLSMLDIDTRGCILFTLDVVSLYTNIPHWEVIIAVILFLEKHRPHGVTPFNPSITDLLEPVLTLNNFEFNCSHYLQVGGTAMGTKVAPSLANIFMGQFEDTYIHDKDKLKLKLNLM